MKKIEQKDLFELKNVGQPVVAGDAFFFTETKMNEKKIRTRQLSISTQLTATWRMETKGQ